jgi:hypothetical protein
MRYLLLTLLASSQAFAGTALLKNLYVSKSVVLDHGTTLQEATQDALSAIPPGFQADTGNGPLIECGPHLVCDPSLAGNDYRVIQPIVQN